MNDDSTSASHQPSQSSNQTSSDSNNVGSSAAAASSADPIQEKRRAQREQTAAFLDHLIRNIDIMIYCQLSILYYLDCSLLSFLLRALPHWFFFTPKPPIFPPTPTNHRPYIGLIFGSNIFCLLLHLLSSPSLGPEATRGYVHGGLVMDFVGQQPVGRVRLVGLDLVCLGLQVLMLVVSIERRRIKGEAGGEDESRGVVGEVERGQDHDAEERGMLRAEAGVVEDIEMRDLGRIDDGRTGGDEDRERDELLYSDLDHAGNALDVFYTGEHIIASLHLLDTIRAQWNASGVSTDVSSATSGVQTAAVVAGRRFSIRFGGRVTGDG